MTPQHMLYDGLRGFITCYDFNCYLQAAAINFVSYFGQCRCCARFQVRVVARTMLRKAFGQLRSDDQRLQVRAVITRKADCLPHRRAVIARTGGSIKDARKFLQSDLLILTLALFEPGEEPGAGKNTGNNKHSGHKAITQDRERGSRAGAG